MAGRYYQVYLDERMSTALDQALEENGRNANAYLKETVRLRMLRDGDLKPITSWEQRVAES